MTAAASGALGARLAHRRSRIVRERIIEAALFLAALVSVFTTVGIVYVLVKESLVFFQHVPIELFLTDTQWTPLFDDAHFGIMVLLSGTLTRLSATSSAAGTWRTTIRDRVSRRPTRTTIAVVPGPCAVTVPAWLTTAIEGSPRP